MSTWTNEKHEAARVLANTESLESVGDVERTGALLQALAKIERLRVLARTNALRQALDEIERLRGLADDPAAVDLVARELCDSARLPGAWDMSDEFDRESFRKEASNLLRAALSPEEGEQA